MDKIDQYSIIWANDDKKESICINKTIVKLNELYLSGKDIKTVFGEKKQFSPKTRRKKMIAWGKKKLNDPKVQFNLILSKKRKEIENTKHTVKTEFHIYKASVWKLTELQPIHTLNNYDKRGWKNYHLDHVLSIKEGFERKLPAETIAHISNLRFIPYKQNTDKGTKTVFTNLFNEDINQRSGAKQKK